MPQQVAPLAIKNRLAGNPSRAPKYFVEAQLRNGDTIQLADPQATRALLALMDMQAVMGGAASHWGGPSAFAELMSVTYGLAFHIAAKSSVDWYEKFHLINDGGHCENGLYALKANYGYAGLSIESLKGFRSIHSPLTGHGEAHLFPEGVYLSNGPLGSALPQSQGLAAADKMSDLDRVTVTAITDGACMEGEAREALASIPGMAMKGQLNPFILIISDNNTKLSGRIDDQSFSMDPTFRSLESLGWDVMFVADGHHIESCLHTLELAYEKVTQNPHRPIAIHAKTIKGYGVQTTVDSSSGGHGFPLKKPTELPAFLKEIYGNKEVPAEFTSWVESMTAEANAKAASSSTPVDISDDIPVEKVQTGIAQAMIDARKAGLPVISVSSDLAGSTGTADFHKAFPEASFDVGVAEANMISVAAGFSKQGYIPIVDTFSQFGVTKGALPITMAALSEAPIIAVFSHAGFQDAADGASHQALAYFAMTSAIPHTDVYSLSTSQEARVMLRQAMDHFVEAHKKGETPRNKIFFLGRENFKQTLGQDDDRIVLGKALEVYDGSEELPADEKTAVTIAAAGPLVHEAILAAKSLLDKHQKTAKVIHVSAINHPDTETIRHALQKTGGRLLTVEDHQISAGMGAQLAHALACEGVSFKLKSLGVEDQFGQSAYTAVQLYRKHGLDADAIENAALELLKE